MKQNIIFDMDGVIFDTERLLLSHWLRTAEKYGFPNAEELYRKIIGLNGAAGKQVLESYYGPVFDYHRDFGEAAREFRENCAKNGIPKKPGAVELLGALKENGWGIALASSTPDQHVRAELEQEHLLAYFDFVIGGNLVHRSKPDPEIFLIAAEALRAEPGETYVIEDSFNGIRAAYAGGFIPVMVPDLMEPDSEILSKAACVCRDLYEVKKLLLRDTGTAKT